MLLFPTNAFAMHCDDKPVFDYQFKVANYRMALDDGCPALGDLWVGRVAQHSFVPLGLLGRLGYFPRGGDLLLHTFDDPDSHRLTHVAHGKTA